ncbi:hypothetical protein BDW62DRAFT_17174 [Aspergillus aurantiobrunneus]
MSPSANLPPPDSPEAGSSESPRKRKKRLERERKKQRQQAQETKLAEQPVDENQQSGIETSGMDTMDAPSTRQTRQVSPADNDEPSPPHPLVRCKVGGKSLPGVKQPALPAPGRGKGKGRQSTSSRQRETVFDEDDDAEGIICKIPCLRCAKSSWVESEDGEPVGPQICRRPRAGLKCFRCTKLHKHCDIIPGPFEAEIVAIRDPANDDDIDLVAATRSWTQRVQTFLRKANAEPEINRTMRSLLHHTFELRNDIRTAWRIGQRLPPSAMIIWPVMDGSEKDDEPDRVPAAPHPRLPARNEFDDMFNNQPTDDYGLNAFL